MKRIMIIGCGGAGKSTLAAQIHQRTGIELIHLDQHFWNPNWVESDKQEWKATVERLSDKEEWIIDGNYGGTMDIRLQKADTIIFLDRSRWLCLYRVLKRLVLNYGKTRKDMAKGCKERFNWEFIQYVYNYNTTRRPKFLQKLQTLDGSKHVFILTSQQKVNAFLKEVSAKC